MSKALRGQPDMLNIPPSDSSHNPQAYVHLIGMAESALGPLLVTSSLLKKSVLWGRFRPGDFTLLHELARRLTVSRSILLYDFPT